MRPFQFKPRHPVVKLGFTPDGRHFVTCQPHTAICLRDILTGDPVMTIPTPSTQLFHELVFDPNSTRFLVITNRGGWWGNLDPLEFSILPTAGCHLGSVTSSGHLRLADLRTVTDLAFRPRADPGSRPLAELGLVRNVQFQSTARWAGFTADGSHLVGIREKHRPVLIDVESATVRVEINSAVRTGQPFAVWAGDTRIAMADGRSVAVFDLVNVAEIPPGKRSKPILSPVLELQAPTETENWFPPLAFAPNGQGMLIGGERERVQFWDTVHGEKRFEWNWRLEKLMSLAFSPDGLTAAAGGRLGRVVMWDLE